MVALLAKHDNAEEGKENIVACRDYALQSPIAVSVLEVIHFDGRHRRRRPPPPGQPRPPASLTDWAHRRNSDCTLQAPHLIERRRVRGARADPVVNETRHTFFGSETQPHTGRVSQSATRVDATQETNTGPVRYQSTIVATQSQPLYR